MENEQKSDRVAAETFHIIDFIREEMDERDWSIWELVRHMAPDGASDEDLGRIKLVLEVTGIREPGGGYLDQVTANQLRQAAHPYVPATT